MDINNAGVRLPRQPRCSSLIPFGVDQSMNQALRIGIIGYGRFGSSFAALLAEHRYSWLAWDTINVVPQPHAATSIADLVARSKLLVLAVPVRAFETALRDLRTQLGSQHQVMDVCSVKQHPCALMDEVLGDAIPHVGCHPLFGPLSMARAEPLRTVLCPSPRHPATVDQARALFDSIGSEVTEMDPAAHDRHMALTHAMAFFVARGLLDLGLGDDLRWTPPSFAALAASIAAVRADAGHLFNAIQRENPYAAATRERLLEALTLIDQRIAQAPMGTEVLAPPRTPGQAQYPPALLEVREHIDELDRELIALLQRRCELSARAAEAKRSVGAPVLDTDRERALLERRGQWAEDAGLPADVVQSIFGQILTISRRAQG